jgi:hypothetical protein
MQYYLIGIIIETCVTTAITLICLKKIAESFRFIVSVHTCLFFKSDESFALVRQMPYDVFDGFKLLKYLIFSVHIASKLCA